MRFKESALENKTTVKLQEGEKVENVLIRRGGVKRTGWGVGAAAGRYSLQKEVGLRNG